jgi:hypothetical protein
MRSWRTVFGAALFGAGALAGLGEAARLMAAA